MNHGLFISHATEDDAFVKQLRITLEGHGVGVWADSRDLAPGDVLSEEIEQAITVAEYLLVVFSTYSTDSRWVKKEIEFAQGQAKTIIPLCLPGVGANLVEWLLSKDIVIIRHDPAQRLSVSPALPQLLAALGRQRSNDAETDTQVAEHPFAELLLKLSDPAPGAENSARPHATAELIYLPADKSQPEVRSQRYAFSAPLGPIEAGELAWYLEHYFLWPVGVFKQRGEEVEKQLPAWGKALYQAALSGESARRVAEAWRRDDADKRFSIEVDDAVLENAADEAKNAAQEAGTELLALPWELIHDQHGWLFQGAQPAQVRRRLPNREARTAVVFDLPIRVLLLSPRPEQQGAGYIDHRVSAAPLAEALAELGELAELTVLSPPTFKAMQDALLQARNSGKPFHVVHFDGHGVYDRRKGLGALCFEDPADESKLQDRRTALVYADQLAAELRAHRIPLVFLEACQTAQSDAAIDASVAGSLLQQGVGSVVAMSHSVLVETARRFVRAFYGELAKGARVGGAMLAAQRALHADPVRGRIPGAGELRLHDWFVPVLCQEQHDPQLFQQLLPAAVQRLAEQRRRLSLGDTPEPPPHRFVGRSRELLALERLLAQTPYAVLRGQGGQGKTTLACELARWLVNTGRFQRAVFVSLEELQNERAVLDAVGRQLLPNWSVAQQDFEIGMQHVQRALSDAATLLVIDNCESVLDEPQSAQSNTEKNPLWSSVASVVNHLLQESPNTRLLFTSRETLPAPFAAHAIQLGPLSRADALQLLAQVLEQHGIPLPAPDSEEYDRAERELSQLVACLNHHARALVLLAPELARRNLHEVTDAAREILAELDAQHPGDRENSLYASIELSLRRLPEGLRALCGGLGVFHGGGHVQVMAMVLEVDDDTANRLAVALIQVGLAEDAGYGHLRLDPALPAYLQQEISHGGTEHTEENQDLSPCSPCLRETYQQRHAAAMEQLLGFLYQQIFKDTEHAFQLTLLELPNLLALLHRRGAELAAGDYSPEQAIDLANRLETLLAPLGRPQALAEAVVLRQQAAALLHQQGGAWSHAHYLQASGDIDRLLQQGALEAAYQIAQKLLQDCLAAGDDAYPGAAYDSAMAHIMLGRVLSMGGAAQPALEPLQQAQTRFETLARDDNPSAARMASACLTDRGDCLRNLGRLEAAAELYEQRIARGEKLDDRRGVATGKFQLGTVRKDQKNYPAALAAYHEARELFSALGEAGSVATAWHQSGMVYQDMKQWDEAEGAYRQAMKIRVQHGLRADEAASLDELGLLYGGMKRLEEAVVFHQQAATIRTQLGDLMTEGRSRNNMAIKLIQLRRYPEARRELLRAIECGKEYGHAAFPWTTWDTLRQLEQAEGNPAAAAEARARALEAYLAYRRDGGENHNTGGRLCVMVLQALQQGQTDAARQQVQGLAQQLAGMSAQERAALGTPEAVTSFESLLPALEAILTGSRAPALAADPALHYDDAAELQLLLENLAEQALDG